MLLITSEMIRNASDMKDLHPHTINNSFISGSLQFPDIPSLFLLHWRVAAWRCECSSLVDHEFNLALIFMIELYQIPIMHFWDFWVKRHHVSSSLLQCVVGFEGCTLMFLHSVWFTKQKLASYWKDLFLNFNQISGFLTGFLLISQHPCCLVISG